VLRYTGYILIVLTAVGLLGAVATVLVGGLAARLRPAGTLRVTALDAIGTPDPGPARIRAVLEDADGGRPVSGVRLLCRFEDGWTTANWTSRGGAVLFYLPQRPEGCYDFHVQLPDTDPRLGVGAAGRLWLRGAQTRVMWVDAAAVLPEAAGAGGAGRPGPAAGPADAVKRLAAGRQVVYLVAAETGEYLSIRERLASPALPAGPAYWVQPGEEGSRLSSLRRAWPAVEGAVVFSAALAGAAADLKALVFRVADADGRWVGPAGEASSWEQVVQRLAAGRGAAGEGDP